MEEVRTTAHQNGLTDTVKDGVKDALLCCCGKLVGQGHMALRMWDEDSSLVVGLLHLCDAELCQAGAGRQLCCVMAFQALDGCVKVFDHSRNAQHLLAAHDTAEEDCM